MLGCSKKNQPWERLPTNQLSLELLQHHKGEEKLPKSCPGSWQDLSMACQEHNPEGFFLSSPTSRKTEFCPVWGCFAEFLPSPLKTLRDAFPGPSSARLCEVSFQNWDFRTHTAPTVWKSSLGKLGLNSKSDLEPRASTEIHSASENQAALVLTKLLQLEFNENCLTCFKSKLPAGNCLPPRCFLHQEGLSKVFWRWFVPWRRRNWYFITSGWEGI